MCAKGLRPGQRPTGAPEPPDATGYAEPFGWWGYHWTQPEARSLLWLISQGALDVNIAAFLSLAIEGRASLIVAAELHEAGKTTLLTALIDFLPASTRVVYLRGWYERFAFLQEVPPGEAYLLCNEISAHLPTYLWGRGVRRVFEVAFNDGYPLATTMHASGAADVFQQLASYPLNVPDEHLAAIDLVVTIGVGYANNRLLRRVARIELIGAGSEGPRAEEIARREPLRAEMTYQLGRLIGVVARLWRCTDEEAAALMARRVQQLQSWIAAGVVTPDDVRAGIGRSRG